MSQSDFIERPLDIIEKPLDFIILPNGIVIISGNAYGCDFIIADPHGCLLVLRNIIDPLGVNDRLFICGDLIDRNTEYSYELLQYLDHVKSVKNIFIIRGNHEDLVLSTLKFLTFIDELEKSIDAAPDREVWKNFVDAEPLYNGLEDMHINTRMDILDVYKEFCEDYKSKRGMNSQGIKDYNTRMLDLFLEETIISEMFSSFTSHISCGGAWLLKLDSDQRAWVADFIEPLPYMIRVAAVQQGDKNIAAFDIVHAAPLNEVEIQEVLQKGRPLDQCQIDYMTWARPSEKCKEGDTIMITAGRTRESPRTYVGHNILSAHRRIYQEMNVLVLDTATFYTDHMFVADHTNNAIYSITSEGVFEPTLYKDLYSAAYDALLRFMEGSPSFVEDEQESCDNIYSSYGVGRKNSFYMSDDEDGVETLLEATASIALKGW